MCGLRQMLKIVKKFGPNSRNSPLDYELQELLWDLLIFSNLNIILSERSRHRKEWLHWYKVQEVTQVKAGGSLWGGGTDGGQWRRWYSIPGSRWDSTDTPFVKINWAIHFLIIWPLISPLRRKGQRYRHGIGRVTQTWGPTLAKPCG